LISHADVSRLKAKFIYSALQIWPCPMYTAVIE
jgi:hypothetical protein